MPARWGAWRVSASRRALAWGTGGLLTLAASVGLPNGAGLLPAWMQQPVWGGAMVLSGLAWSAWAGLTLARAGTPVWGRARPRVLVEEGPYAWGRHPMALGGLVAGLGGALALGAPLLALAVGVLAWWLTRWLLPAEEARLAQVFGGWWRDYAQRVRLWC